MSVCGFRLEVTGCKLRVLNPMATEDPAGAGPLPWVSGVFLLCSLRSFAAVYIISTDENGQAISDGRITSGALTERIPP